MRIYDDTVKELVTKGNKAYLDTLSDYEILQLWDKHCTITHRNDYYTGVTKVSFELLGQLMYRDLPPEYHAKDNMQFDDSGNYIRPKRPTANYRI